MSEIGKEMEEEEEEVVDHWSHHHPLTLVQTSIERVCHGCHEYVSIGKHMYGCSKKCAKKIRHPMHPQHILIQNQNSLGKCAICERHMNQSTGYECTSSDCEFVIHMRCAQDRGVMDADDDAVIHSHPSHPQHPLVRVSRRPCSLRCDACGTTHKGIFYACSACQYWIHHTCATLPDTIQNMLPMSSAPMSTLSIPHIKCASLLDPVYHLAHPHHLLNHLSVEDMLAPVYDHLALSHPLLNHLSMEDMLESSLSILVQLRELLSSFEKRDKDQSYYINRRCDAGCGKTAAKSDCYVSGSRDFVVHVRCAAPPASITDRRWDDHPLMLTYAANENDRRGVFYCNKCEQEIYPWNWMYHCRHCDSSFHPDCFPTISGKYRNIKFGQQYIVATAHPHPLTYHLLTVKRRCDACGLDKHGERGFQCVSCYFFICLDQCGKEMLEQGHIQTAD